MKIVKSIEGTGLLTKGVNKTIKHEAKNKSLLGNLLTGKGITKGGTTKVDKGTIKTGQKF